MSQSQPRAATFEALRGILQRHAKSLRVIADAPDDFQVASPTLVDRTGRPLFVAAVQVRKHYVSFHLMPVYAIPELNRAMSPELRKRMQGKACFNFTTLDPAHVKELTALTKRGIALFEQIELPWARGTTGGPEAARRASVAKGGRPRPASRRKG